jgi:hypothetical protein
VSADKPVIPGVTLAHQNQPSIHEAAADAERRLAIFEPQRLDVRKWVGSGHWRPNLTPRTRRSDDPLAPWRSVVGVFGMTAPRGRGSLPQWTT